MADAEKRDTVEFKIQIKQMFTTKISWFLSSNPALGGVQTDPNGGQFTVQLSEPYEIPRNASNITVSLLQSIVWNSQINVVDGVNNRLYYRVAGIDTSVVVPTGNYDLHSLSETLNQVMFQNVPSLPIGSLQIYLKGAYCVLEATVRGANYIQQFQLGLPGDVSLLLGFLPQTLVFTGLPVIGTEESWESDSSPPLKDGTRELLLGSTLVAKGVRVNGKFSQVLSKINFGHTAPGSQLIYAPALMNNVPCDLGAGRVITEVKSFLTNAATGELISTNGEYWSYVAILSFEQPLYDEEPNKKRKM